MEELIERLDCCTRLVQGTTVLDDACKQELLKQQLTYAAFLTDCKTQAYPDTPDTRLALGQIGEFCTLIENELRVEASA